MSKTIEEIVISPEGIDVISSIDDVDGVVYNVTQLSLTEQENEKEEIFEKNNISNIANYPFDINIVRALSDNDGQLKDYLETCRRANYTRGKIEMPDSIPDIIYDLTNLKKEPEDNVKLDKNAQIEMFRRAKETKRLLNRKAKLRMGILDRAYFTVQEFLQQSKNKKSIQALNAGVVNNKEEEPDKFASNEFRETLHSNEYTELTNAISEKYLKESENINGQTIEKETEQEKKDEELVQ